MRIALAVYLASLIVLAGCGGDDDEDPASEPSAATELTITLDPDGPGGELPEEGLVTCPGPAAPPSVCKAIDELPEDPAAPVPPDTACTEIYGGPDVVTIEGTLDGEPIDTELTRSNGCEIERFERFLPVLETLFPDYRPGESLAS